MAALTIRNVDETLKRRLRLQAAEHDRSMEEEAREILRRGTATRTGQPDQKEGLGTRMRRRFIESGRIELEVPPREPELPLRDVFDE